MKSILCYIFGHKRKFAFAWNRYGEKTRQGAICLRWGCDYIQRYAIPAGFFRKKDSNPSEAESV